MSIDGTSPWIRSGSATPGDGESAAGDACEVAPIRGRGGARLRALSIAALVAIAAGAIACASPTKEAAMTVERLESVLREISGELESQREGVYHFDFYGVPVACVTNVEHNRMRIYAPIVAINQVSGEQFRRMLDANFHSSLDARYATSEGFVYSLFLHPLSSLGESQLRSAVIQVASLAKTFGSTYSSGVLQYGDPGEAL